MNLLTKTLSPTSRVGTMLLEGIQKASKMNGRTRPKTSAKATRRMIKNSTNPLVFGGESRPCWSSLGKDDSNLSPVRLAYTHSYTTAQRASGFEFPRRYPFSASREYRHSLFPTAVSALAFRFGRGCAKACLMPLYSQLGESRKNT